MSRRKLLAQSCSLPGAFQQMGSGWPQIDSIAATSKQMSDQEAAEIADFIFSLFLRISEKHHSSS